MPNVSVKHDKVDKEQINRATALNTDFEVAGQKVKAEDLGFNTNEDKAQEVTKDEERHLDAELHTDLLGKDKQEELKKAGGIISDLTTALGNKGQTDALENKGKTEGNFLERYKQLSMVREIGDQVEKNPEYLSILDKKAIKNEKIDDDVQKEQVSVMNKLLNDALRAKGYAGPDIKMVLTDVTDPNGPYYTDTLTNVVVFDRKQLANLDRDKILNILGHEFGHYSKEDNKTGNQTIANYTGDKLEDRTKGMVAKEATEDTLAAIRNNPNVITGDEGKKLAESIPMEKREYQTLEWNVTGSAANEKVIGGIRASFTNSIYQSFDLKNDRAVKYTAITTSIGGGNSDVSAGIGIGLYLSDSPEEISKLTISHGGSIEILKTVSIGMDFLSENKEGQNFLQKLSNVKGVRLYIGKSIPVSSDSLLEKFLPAKLEKHISVLDIGNINIIKDRTILDYWEDESIPSGARAYYQYYYKK